MRRRVLRYLTAACLLLVAFLVSLAAYRLWHGRTVEAQWTSYTGDHYVALYETGLYYAWVTRPTLAPGEPPHTPVFADGRYGSAGGWFDVFVAHGRIHTLAWYRGLPPLASDELAQVAHAKRPPDFVLPRRYVSIDYVSLGILALLLPTWLMLRRLARSPAIRRGVRTVTLPALRPAARWLANAASRLLAAVEASDGRCRRCGYDLRATPDRCPECGTLANPLLQHATR